VAGRGRYVGAAAFSVVVAAVVLAAVVGSGPGSSRWTGAALTGNGHVENGHYCDGCAPPLAYRGGPVVDTSGSSGLTIIPIYWQPAGGEYTFPPGYVSAVSGYIADVADASGASQNVYSLVGEYYGRTSTGRRNLRYLITAGEPILDTAPFPAGRCRPAGSEYGICLTDAQLRTELARVIRENGLPTGLSAFYPVFFPDGVETMDSEGATSADTYCGYHRNFGPQTTTGVILYGNEPLPTTGCDGGQAPNGSLVIDGSINVLSHEIIETITDPVDPPAWNDRQGYEIADICADSYGSPLGSTDPGNPGRTQYNQVINGGKYYTQTEFSNAAYAKFGVGNGCQQSRVGAQKPAANVSRIVISSQAYPASLPADGRATATDEISVWDRPTENGIGRDSISVSSYVVAGDGSCGTVRKTRGTTDGYGSLDVTYVASTDDVICALVATEAKGGKSSTALVYQGAARAVAPTASDTFPTTLRAGGTSLFTVTFGNRTGKAVPFGTVDFAIFPAAKKSPNVNAGQIRLAASIRGRGGPFIPLKLYGSTVQDGQILGTFYGPSGKGLTIPAHAKVTVTFRVTLAANVPSRGATPVLSFEAYLEQLNLATGSGSTLADTEATDIAVRR
jgi:hypothetical protein